MKTARDVGEAVKKIEESTKKEIASVRFDRTGDFITDIVFFERLGKVVIKDESK